MNLNVLLVVGVCGVLLWVLVRALRTGEFSIENRTPGSPSCSFTRLRGDDNPVGFWMLAVRHVAAVIGFGGRGDRHARRLGAASGLGQKRVTLGGGQSGRSAAW